MIRDGRSGKLIVLAHCILNTNSICRGPMTPRLWPGMINPIVEKVMEYNVGVFQLPCPEFITYGLDRPAVSRESLEGSGFRDKCREIATSVSGHLREYAVKGYKLIALVGLRGSPSCSPGLNGRGKGIFFEELEKALKAHSINLPMVDFERTEVRRCVEDLEEVLSSS
ncbi:MAG: hypothetical protein QXR65_00230 [Candidatus Bathyarchaeia archaeon]